MTDTPLEQWLCYLETLHPNPMDLGLARVGQVARALGLLPAQAPVVTIAGTNGKGSTVAVLEALLCAAGKRPGAFTSPHLVRFNERIRVGGKEVDDAVIIAAFEAIEAVRGTTTLTYFEFGLLAALWVFRQQAVDCILLEVGLGGRLDAANIVDADVAVITSIDLDHQQWLGETRDVIAREKAGILRAGRPAVLADPAPPLALLAAVTEYDARPVLQIGRDFLLPEEAQRGDVTLTAASGQRRTLHGVRHAELLPANIAAALQAAELLGLEFDESRVHTALAGLQLRGRRQLRSMGGRQYLFDVAHNPAAILKLLEKLDASDCSGRRIALFSAMKDKAVVEMLAPCRAYMDYWLLPEQPDNPRAMPAPEVASLLHELGESRIELCEDIPAAARRCRELLEPGDLAVVFGSFFTVGGVLASLEEGPEAAVSNE
ncbi:bifunctional folylpolyglutamate synthase/dihydrofolate synthase [Haliea sp. E17]|uniref:bifunctional folylpolyglutamate synthase/dihydrofolate synthase n=1 Tax=Haliea sp. E17 TaxID=3401576 RepID=UPI003AAEB394